jgi:transcriptional regulator GlxA family with amidase domain
MYRERTSPALIGVVVYEGVEPIDIGGTVGVVSMARRVLPAIEAITIASAAGLVALAGGLTMVASHGFAGAPDCDVHIITGGPGWREQVTDPAMLAFIRSRPPGTIASVCTGALILGAAGVLDGHSATTRRHAVGAEATAPLDLLTGLAKDMSPVAAAIVEDRGLMTGGGVSLAIDATLYLIGRIYGPEARDDVARVIEYDRAYAANRAALGHVHR